MSIHRSRALKRNHLCAALLAVLVLPAATALAQTAEPEQAPATPAPAKAQNLDKVTVTGSRISRVNVEGPAPVTIITAADIEKEGFSTVYDALNTLTQFTGSVQNELNQNGFTPNASFLNLRGLGPGYQLVLINGRRTADYPMPYNSQSNAVNLASIPSAAIDRIEVLSGGASAIYGSDAVAGVVNVILKTNYEGDLVTVRAGTTTRGGGDTGRFQWVGGKTGDNWSLTYAGEYLTREAIYGYQRKFMDSFRDDPSLRDPANATTAYEGTRFTVRRNAVTGNPTTGPGIAVREYPGGVQAVCDRFPEFEAFKSNPALAAPDRCGYFGWPASQAIRNSDKNLSAYVYGTYDFNDNVQAWASVNLVSTEANVASNSRFVQSATVLGSNNFYDPNYNAVVGNVLRIITPSEISSSGGGQPSHYKEFSVDVAAGLRGSMFNNRFDWDATLSHARYEMKEQFSWMTRDKTRDFFFGPRLGTHTATGLPIYRLNTQRMLNPLTPSEVAQMTSRYKNEADSQVTQGSLVISGDLFEMPAGPLAMAAVLEGATQKYDLSPDARVRLGYTGNDAPMGLTNSVGGGKRDRYSVGVEFSIPIVQTLKASLAGRYDKFNDASDINGAFTWSAGLEWRPIDSLLLRGSYATSFKAPDMHYIYAGQSGFYTTILDEYACRSAGLNPTKTECTGSADYAYQVFGTRTGDPRLDAEEGKSYTAGIVWDVRDNLSLSVDYYNIKLEGAIADLAGLLFREEAACLLGTSRNGTPVDVNSARCAEFISRVTRDPVTGEVLQFDTFPQNQALSKTSGIDARATYKLDTDRWGDFSAELSWTHVLKMEGQEFDGERMINFRDHPQYFNFRSRLNWQMGWEKNDWNVSLYGYRWGSLPNWAETGRIAPYIVWNGNVRKKITNKATVGIYVNNLFDKLHPRDDTFNTYPYFWRAYSPIGREVFVQFDYKFN